MLNLADLARKLNRQSLKSRDLVESCLVQIADPNGEGDRTYLSIFADRARAEADQFDLARQQGWSVPPLAGIPISIKDLFDTAGDVTRAGSRVLDEQPPATVDAPVVQRLRQAGFIILGKTNMTEFAFSGLGINEHFGTPLSPFERKLQRISGGSSSGSAVSVSDNMAAASLGTDTGGSCRIPAAFCGIVGFKPTSHRVPRTGVIPLSKSFDCVGPLARSVSCCAILDDVISGNGSQDVASYPESGLRLGVLEGTASEDIDEQVGATFSAALTRLSQRGVRLSPVTISEFDQLDDLYEEGGIVGAEAYAWHQSLLANRGDLYDPWIRQQIEYSHAQKATTYIKLLERRLCFNAKVAEKTVLFDALVLPTVAIVPPQLEALHDDTVRSDVNQLVLRNTAIGNMLDRPCISLPCNGPGETPVGLMLMGQPGDDRKLLSIARGLEYVIRP